MNVSSTVTDSGPARTPSPGLVNLVDPEVRAEARRLRREGRVSDADIADVIGVTIDELRQALRWPVRNRTGR